MERSFRRQWLELWTETGTTKDPGHIGMASHPRGRQLLTLPARFPNNFPQKSLDSFGQAVRLSPCELVARGAAITAPGPPTSRSSKEGEKHLAWQVTQQQPSCSSFTCSRFDSRRFQCSFVIRLDRSCDMAPKRASAKASSESGRSAAAGTPTPSPSEASSSSGGRGIVALAATWGVKSEASDLGD